MTVVRIPAGLRADVGGARQVEVDGSTVGEALRALVDAYPALAGRVLDEGRAPQFLNLFVDGTDVRALRELETPLAPDSTLLLLPAMAGG